MDLVLQVPKLASTFNKSKTSMDRHHLLSLLDKLQEKYAIQDGEYKEFAEAIGGKKKPIEFNEKSVNQVIIDIRTPQEFSQGHIEGAININYFDSSFLNQIGQYDKSKPVFLYCRSGNRTSSAAAKIAKLGF